MIDGEPKDGDYVRYIEQLAHRGQSAPGQVSAGMREPAAGSAAGPAPGQTAREAGQPAGRIAMPWKTGANRDDPARTIAEKSNTEPETTGSPGQPPSRDDTLAARAGKRRSAVAVTIVALAIVWQAIRLLAAALRAPQFDWNDLVPVAFLLIFAGVLWRAATSQRSRANQPPARLPPLTTLPTGAPGKSRR
ncbi:hypothetical protein CAL14_08165 [Bordetella genomosp. 9]|uniref:hypothetical protein n=1 Tax=Bordetella genomosp. 9 TaxID=1416803 RepID=UPI000A28F24C|nr:hypothetical protein [Bordetella genomosp. 9]ARP90264.1 hypothetical protein CAL14_08165 [Bordetella genomosp. 9]